MGELVRAEVGTVMAKGRPYELRRTEVLGAFEDGWYANWVVMANLDNEVWIDPDWVKPIDLPTEPTWGIAVEKTYGHKTREQRSHVAKWVLEVDDNPELNRLSNGHHWIRANLIVGFIRLSDEQIEVMESL